MVMAVGRGSGGSCESRRFNRGKMMYGENEMWDGSLELTYVTFLVIL